MSATEGSAYKQPWFWLIITPLLVVIVAGFYLLYLSIVTMDGVVVDSHYKDGRGIVVSNEQIALANTLNLNAAVIFNNNGQVSIKLNGGLTIMPEALNLLIAFPTAQNRDVSIVVAHQGRGEYIGELKEPITGRRQLVLQPNTDSPAWRLHFDGLIDRQESTITLLPNR